MARSIPITGGQVYHVYNRGNQKQKLFSSERDYVRMLFLILAYQSPKRFMNTKRHVDYFEDRGDFNIDRAEITDNRSLDLINFCIMPNHFHLTVQPKEDDSLGKYLHRIQNAYATYFNTKHEKSGHVFQGSYKAKLVTDEAQLKYLSAYIHKNPQELSEKNDYHSWRWSSYQDYVGENRWGELLQPGIILDEFKTGEYEEFVTESPAKDPEVATLEGDG